MKFTIKTILNLAVIFIISTMPATASGPVQGTYDLPLIQPAPPKLTCYTATDNSHWRFVNCDGRPVPEKPKPKPEPPKCRNVSECE